MHTIEIINAIIFIYVILKLITVCSAHRATDYIRSCFTLVFGLFFMYFSHVAQHKFNNSVFGRVHALFHHNPKCKHEWYAKIIEFINNLQLLIFILVNNVIKQIAHIELFSNYVLFALTFYYIWTHFIEFHYFPSCVHNQHHAFDNEENHNHSLEIQNYGPHIIDMLFNTHHACNDATVYVVEPVKLVKMYAMYYATRLIYKIKK